MFYIIIYGRGLVHWSWCLIFEWLAGG